jgi:ankyrin repeat protein
MHRMNRTAAIAAVVLLSAAAAAAQTAGAPAQKANDVRVPEAAKRRDTAALRTLVKQADVNARLGDGATALHWAAYWEDADAVDLLIAAGATVDVANDYSVTPLWLAAQNGNLKVVERLLAAGANANWELPTGETVLMTAAQGGRAEVVAALVAKGANVNAKEKSMGQTPLMWAVAERHGPVARLLVEKGADVKAASAAGFTPFLFAARTGDIETASFLLSKGAGLTEAAKDGMTALHVAVVRGHVPFAKFLLDRGFDVNASGPGFTALHWAVGTWESVFTHDYVFPTEASTQEYEWLVLGGIPSREVKIDFIKTLVGHGADVNAPVKRAPPRYGASIFPSNYLAGGTPFHVAASVADVPIMKLLLSLGADPKRAASDQTTPLMVAAGLARVDSETLIPEKNLIEAVQLCLDLGHDINAANAAGNTAMHAAALQGLDGMVQFLVDRGAGVNPKNKKGETPTKIADGYESASMLYTRPSTAALLRKLGGVAE